MKILEPEHWERREIFEFFSGVSQPFYTLSFNLDVSRLYDFAHERGISFYLACVWVVSRAVNSVPAFLISLEKGELVRLEGRSPSFTDMKPGSECFHIVSTHAEDDIESFCRRAKKLSLEQSCFIDCEKESSSLIYISCLPWLELSCATNERNFDRDDSVPRVTWGKYFVRDGRKMLNFSLEVNHRFIDGVHAGQLAQAMEEIIKAL